MSKTYIGSNNNIAQKIEKIYIGIEDSDYHILPNGYTQLKYIQSDYLNYFDTGVEPTINTKVVADFKIMYRQYGYESYIFGMCSNTDDCLIRAGLGAYGTAFENSNNLNTYSQSDVTKRTTVTALSSGTSSVSIYIFAQHENNRAQSIFGEMRLYSLQIYENNVLIKNYVAAKRDSDNELGLYDLVNNTFLTKVENVPSTYQRVEYVENTTNQYFNTGYNIATSTGIYIKFKSPISGSTIDPVDFFGVYNSNSNLNKNSYFLSSYNNTENNLIFRLNTKLAYINYTPNEIVRYAHSKITNSIADTNGNYVSVTTSTTTEYPLYLFRTNGGGTPLEYNKPVQIKLYDFKITENYMPVHNYTPVIRKSDNKPGLYDIIDQEFLTSIGEDELLYGDPIQDFVGGNPKLETKTQQIKKGYIGIQLLPNEYTQLKYIENNNYEYIDSGVVLTPNIKVEADFQITEKKYGFETWIFGNSENNKCKLKAGVTTTNTFYTSDGTVTYSQTSDIFARTTVTATASSGTSPNTTLMIFASRNAEKIEGVGKIRLYSCKIYNNNTLIRHFIPCKRKSDSVNGLYDIINKVFYTNINLIPSEFQQVEYIQGTGSQYIDSGCSTNQDRGTYVTFNTNNSVSTEDNGAIFGVGLTTNSIRYYLETYENGSDLSEHSGYFWIGGQAWASVNAKITPDTKLTIAHSAVTKTVATNDNSYENSTTTPVTPESMYIFAYNDTSKQIVSSTSRTKLYYLSFFDKSTKVHEYIPVIRKSDNKPGLYDIISNTCLFNSGEDEFLYGDPVTSFISGSTLPQVTAQLIYSY